MSTWIQTWEAQRIAALNAYGYSDVLARTPNMSVEFARTMIDGWAKIASSYDDVDVYTEEGRTSTGTLGAAQPYLASDLATLRADAVLVDNTFANVLAEPTPIWNHTFAIASILDNGYVQGPTIYDLPGEIAAAGSDAASFARKLLNRGLEAIKPTVFGTGLLLLGLFMLYLYVEVKS